MNKNIKYIAILVAIILLVIGIILINNNRPINIYRKQVKTIVKEMNRNFCFSSIEVNLFSYELLI